MGEAGGSLEAGGSVAEASGRASVASTLEGLSFSFSFSLTSERVEFPKTAENDCGAAFRVGGVGGRVFGNGGFFTCFGFVAGVTVGSSGGLTGSSNGADVVSGGAAAGSGGGAIGSGFRSSAATLSPSMTTSLSSGSFAAGRLSDSLSSSFSISISGSGSAGLGGSGIVAAGSGRGAGNGAGAGKGSGTSATA